jgi:acetyl esterase/lipase
VEVIKDIEYGRAGDTPLLLDMYIPDTPISAPTPAVIWIHGAASRQGDKAHDYDSRRSTSWAQHGFLVISINYRLIKAAIGSDAFRAELRNCVEDCKCAVRWLRANAEKYNVDPERIGVSGHSAGGHLAMMVGCADETAGLEGDGGWEEYSSRVQAVVSYAGAIRPKSDRTCPVNHVTDDDPPLLLVHGELDPTVPIESAEQMYEAYQQAGLEATLVRVREAGHGFQQENISPSPDEIEQIVLDFFIEHLVVTR